ncbi:MFS transporter [Pseudomonas sp. MWU16-30317]|uniref:MFS transporter n=1 Tax=Pseudomonas sp. MWU16-30317 TaxID=2878095 RepID=UPI001CFB991D|nr:MFS transporter [Pseudomonas sp. MWU16-30317]
MPAATTPAADTRAITLQIVSIVFYTFIAFFCIGLPIAVLPGYVHDQLGFSAVVAGLVIGIQYLATLLSRPVAGHLADSLGTKRTIVYGLAGIGVAGLLTLISTLVQSIPDVSLGILLVARVILGTSQGLIGVGTTSWGINQVGAEHSARVISWSGIASYGAIALGAPLGVVLVGALSFNALGVVLMVLAGVALWLIRNKPSLSVVRGGERMPFWSAFARVAPYGAMLALASIGYGTLTTFITLYYVEQHWLGAAYCLTAFGISFVIARMVFINAINHLGGFTVSIICMSVEVVGLVFLWLAPNPVFALIGASLTGFGLSLVYPALGVVAIHQVPPSSRGAGLGAFAVFFDLSLAIAGPLMGGLAASFGYASIYFAAALLALAGLGLTQLYRRRAGEE